MNRICSIATGSRNHVRCRLTQLSGENKKSPPFLGEDSIAGRLFSHRRLRLACPLNLNFQRDEFPNAENLGAVGAEIRLRS